jgi:hypothetical protein
VEAVAGLQVGDIGVLGTCRAGHRPSQYGKRRRCEFAVARAIPRSTGPFSGDALAPGGDIWHWNDQLRRVDGCKAISCHGRWSKDQLHKARRY